MMINVVERAKELRKIIELLAQDNMTDEDAIEACELFQQWSGDGRTYTIGERVRYDGLLYRCLQEHQSQTTWNPKDAPSLFARVLIPEPTIPEWIQPESTNPYMKGDKVRHIGKVWVSIIDGNVWEPSVYGWDEVIQ